MKHLLLTLGCLNERRFHVVTLLVQLGGMVVAFTGAINVAGFVVERPELHTSGGVQMALATAVCLLIGGVGFILVALALEHLKEKL